MQNRFTKLRSTLAAIAAVVLFGGLAAFSWAAHTYDKIEMTQEELQRKTNDKLPFTSKQKITVDSVAIDLSEGYIALDFAAHTTRLKQTLAITGHTRGAIDYRPQSWAFFFREPKVQLGTITVNEHELGDTVNRLLDRIPSQRVQERREQVSQQVRAEIDHFLTEAVAYYLENHPVYDLNKAKYGTVIHMALQSVEVQPGKVIAHISLWQFAGMAVFYAIASVVGALLFLLVGLALIGLPVGI